MDRNAAGADLHDMTLNLCSMPTFRNKNGSDLFRDDHNNCRA